MGWDKIKRRREQDAAAKKGAKTLFQGENGNAHGFINRKLTWRNPHPIVHLGNRRGPPPPLTFYKVFKMLSTALE